MQLGDKITQIVGYNPYGLSVVQDIPMTGEVVYIHPRGRFYTLEFTCENGMKFRESFKIIKRRRV